MIQKLKDPETNVTVRTCYWVKTEAMFTIECLQLLSVKNIYFIKIQVTEGLKTVQELEIIGVTQRGHSDTAGQNSRGLHHAWMVREGGHLKYM